MNVITQNSLRPNAIICDLDGTLAIHNGRGPFELHKVITDIVCEPVHRILKKFCTETFVILLSGREDRCREDTEKWLKYNQIPYEILMMRSTGDGRPDEIVKSELYERYIAPHYNVLFILDDRPKVVRMWRKKGLYVLDCNQTGKEF